jgi:hypothetical protein
MVKQTLSVIDEARLVHGRREAAFAELLGGEIKF